MYSIILRTARNKQTSSTWRRRGGYLRVGATVCIASIASGLLFAASASAVSGREAAAILLPPGVHPRVLFTSNELAQIRAKAQMPCGKTLLAHLKWNLDQPYQGAYDQLRTNKSATGKSANPVNVINGAFNAAILYMATEDTNYLNRAIDMTGFWLSLTNHPTDGRQGYKFALIYDTLYSELPDNIRTGLREYMAGRMTTNAVHVWKHMGYYMGPCLAGRPCDWGALAAGGYAMQWLAIEGEDPRASPEFLQEILSFAKYFLDYGLSPEGQLLAGNGYADQDLDVLGYALRALQRHGIPLVDHPNLKPFPVWLAYESLPGLYHFDNRNYSSGHHTGLSSMLVTLAERYGSPANWLGDQALGPDRTASMGVPALLYGTLAPARLPPPDLPLHYWSSSMGTVFSRSGWTNGNYFCITMEPPGGGHAHADKGSFTFYSHGLNFAADSGPLVFPSECHNTILIDGRGQGRGAGPLNDAIVRAVQFSNLGDMTYMDVKPAYDFRVAKTHTRTGVVNGHKLEYGLGLPFYWATNYPVRHADRYVVYVRGSVQPYVVIVDDIQKDDQPHRYQWLMHHSLLGEIVRSNQATLVSRFGGRYFQSETGAKRAAFSGDLPSNGVYSVYVMMRKWPDLKNWFSHTITVYVNGKPTPYFRFGDYMDDWRWCGAGSNLMKAGKNTVEVGVKRGARVAQALVTEGTNQPPPMALTTNRPGCYVFPWTGAASNLDWSVGVDPQARLDVYFIQPLADGMKLDMWKVPKYPQGVFPCLRAEQKTVRAGFAAVLIPHDDTDPAPVFQMDSSSDGQAELTWGPACDYLFSNPAQQAVGQGGVIVSDGKFALVRTEGKKIKAYLLVGGTILSFRGQRLIQSSAGPVYVMNDGQTLQAQSPQGAIVEADKLSVTNAICNREPRKLSRWPWQNVTMHALVLDKKWDITFSEDQTVVYVKGDGPRPLKIHAPKAIKCVVNGVSVWYSREAGGYLYPKLELTVLTHGTEPLNSTPADAMPDRRP